jgi:hypothetical protein
MTASRHHGTSPSPYNPSTSLLPPPPLVRRHPLRSRRQIRIQPHERLAKPIGLGQPSPPLVCDQRRPASCGRAAEADCRFGSVSSTRAKGRPDCATEFLAQENGSCSIPSLRPIGLHGPPMTVRSASPPIPISTSIPYLIAPAIRPPRS